jgi:hypothetical protein
MGFLFLHFSDINTSLEQEMGEEFSIGMSRKKILLEE